MSLPRSYVYLAITSNSPTTEQRTPSTWLLYDEVASAPYLHIGFAMVYSRDCPVATCFILCLKYPIDVLLVQARRRPCATDTFCN